MKLGRGRLKTLIGVSVFVSLYASALFVFASMTYVVPGTVQDPAGIPGEYTVGFSTNPNEVLYTNDSNQLASDSYFTRKPTLNDAANQTIGNYLVSTSTNTDDTTNGVIGVDMGLIITDNFNRTVNSQIGFIGGISLTGTGTIDTAIGSLGLVLNQAGGTIDIARSVVGRVLNIGGGTVNNGYLFYGGTIAATNKYGIYIDQDDSINVLRELQLWAESPLKWFDNDSSNYVAFKAPSDLSTDTTYTLPDGYGSSGDVLSSDGAGGLSWITPSSGGSSVVNEKVSVSSGEILTINSAPVTIVPAPGPGKFIELLKVYIKYNYGTADYNTATRLTLIDTVNGSQLLKDAGFPYLLSTSQSSLRELAQTTDELNVGTTEGGGVSLSVTGGSDPTDGDGTLDVYITYIIRDL